MVDAAYPSLQQRPEPFNRVRVHIPAHVDVRRVLHGGMLIAHLAERVIRLPLVCVHRRRGMYARRDLRQQRLCRGIGDYAGDDFAVLRLLRGLALRHAEHRRLIHRAASLAKRLPLVLPLGLAADINLIHLYRAIQRLVIRREQRTDLFEHPVGRLVSNAQFPLKLLGRNAAPSASHEVHSIEPETERGGRILEDRPDHRMLMVAAELAHIGRSPRFAVMLSYPLAGGAVNPIRVQRVHKVVKARRIVGEFPVEFKERVTGFRSSRALRIVPVDLRHGGYLRAA